MKGKINNETRARFFAQYWGQRIGVDLNEQVDVVGCNFKAQSAFTEAILLKPLSSISDEDAEVIAKIYGAFYDTDNDIQDIKDHVLLALIEDDEEAYSMWDHIGFQKMAIVTDFLRSKGYVLPYLGLSVEEMVKAGWIKLTK